MLDARAKIIIEAATTQAQQQLKGLQGSLSGVQGEARKSQGVWSSLKSGIAGIGVATVAATAAFYGIKKAYDATVASTQAYAKQVRDLSRLIGSSAEETSRLIQVADDVMISYDDMRVALQAAIRKGIEPSIAGISKLSDQYNAIQDPIARSKFLMDTFGRSGAALGPLMERGAAGIRSLGDAVNDGLILSAEQVQAARDLEIAQDKLNDAWRAMTTILGNAVIPVVTNLIEQITTLATMKPPAILEYLRNRYGYYGEEAQHAHNQAIAAAQRDMESLSDLRGALDDTVGAVDNLTSAQGFQAAAEAIIAGDFSAAKHYLDLAAQAGAAERKILAVTEALRLADGNTAVQTMILRMEYINNGGGGGGVDNSDFVNPQAPRNSTNTRTIRQSGRASGGPLNAGITLVGEQGPELIIGRTVLPANITRQLLARGVMPGTRAAAGAALGDESFGGWSAPKTSYKTGQTPYVSGSKSSESGFSLVGGTGGGGTSSTTTATAAAVAEAVQQDSAQQTAVILAALPSATEISSAATSAAQQMAQANSRGQKEIAEKLDTMIAVLLRQGTSGDVGLSVRDAIQGVQG